MPGSTQDLTVAARVREIIDALIGREIERYPDKGYRCGRQCKSPSMSARKYLGIEELCIISRGIMVTGYEWLRDRGWEWLGQAYAFAFVRAVTPETALEKLAGVSLSVHTARIGEISNIPGEGSLLCAVDVGGWTVVVEPFPVCIGTLEQLTALSVESEVVAVIKEFSGVQSFSRIIDGVVETSFDPMFPNERSGRIPDMLDTEIIQIGFSEDSPDGNELQCLQLADLITGTHVPPATFARPQLWVRVAKSQPEPATSYRGDDPELARLIDGAPVHARCQAIAHFITVSAGQAGLAADSRLKEAVARIEGGISPFREDDTALEGRIRAWEQAQVRAMDDVAEARNPEEVRVVRQAYMQGVVAQAIRLAVEPSQPVAAYRVLAKIDSASFDPIEVSLRRTIISILTSDGRI